MKIKNIFLLQFFLISVLYGVGQEIAEFEKLFLENQKLHDGIRGGLLKKIESVEQKLKEDEKKIAQEPQEIEKITTDVTAKVEKEYAEKHTKEIEKFKKEIEQFKDAEKNYTEEIKKYKDAEEKSKKDQEASVSEFKRLIETLTSANTELQAELLKINSVPAGATQSVRIQAAKSLDNKLLAAKADLNDFFKS